jgi:hypothetical protein
VADCSSVVGTRPVVGAVGMKPVVEAADIGLVEQRVVDNAPVVELAAERKFVVELGLAVAGKFAELVDERSFVAELEEQRTKIWQLEQQLVEDQQRKNLRRRR